MLIEISTSIPVGQGVASYACECAVDSVRIMAAGWEAGMMEAESGCYWVKSGQRESAAILNNNQTPAQHFTIQTLPMAKDTHTSMDSPCSGSLLICWTPE